jgi:uncharacterized FlgJ-related protein
MNIDQLIYNTAIEQGFNPAAAKLIAAQARFESNDYKSNVFKNNNNTSGIKFIGQANAVRGTLSPEGDYYAHFNTIEDGINDKIVRLYNITMKGVTPKQLKDSTDATEFANLLKQRGYYGGSASEYASGLRAKLLKINVLEYIKDNANYGFIILVAVGLYFYIKNLKKKNIL